LGRGGLPGAQWRGADPPRVSRQRSVQSFDAFAPPEPSTGMGSDHADDHRRSLSGCQRRTPGTVGLTELWTSSLMTIGRFPRSKLSSPNPNFAKFGQIAKVQYSHLMCNLIE